MKLAHSVAARIEHRIVSEALEIGHNLGSEADLVREFGVSRAIFREAITLLSRKGRVSVRQGNVGGITVTEPSEGTIANGLRQYLAFVARDVREVGYIRGRLQERAWMLATERIRDEDVEDILALVAFARSLTDPRRQVSAAIRLLLRLTEAAANSCLTVLITSLCSLTLERFGALQQTDQRLMANSEYFLSLHIDLAMAVVGQDISRSCRVDTEIFDLVQALSDDDLGDTSVHEDPGQARLRDAFPEASESRLSSYVARRIKDRIVREDLKEGDRLGSEADLMESLGVSRAVLREGIRILENVSVVKMLRGRTGGLQVLKPDPDLVINNARMFLTSNGIGLKAVQEVGGALDLAAIEMATRRHAGGEPVPLRLLSDLAATQCLTWRNLAMSYYTVLGELSGSRALRLMMELLSALISNDAGTLADGLYVRATYPRRTRDLINAVSMGDVDLARRRLVMLRRTGARLAPGD